MTIKALRSQAQPVLAWLATLALTASVTAGGQSLILCISSSGGVDIRHPDEACRSCPGPAVPDLPPNPGGPNESDSPLSDGERCCYDLLLAFQPSICTVPRAGTLGVSPLTSAPIASVVPPDREHAASSAGSLPAHRSPPCGHHDLISLRSVLLLI